MRNRHYRTVSLALLFLGAIASVCGCGGSTPESGEPLADLRRKAYAGGDRVIDAVRMAKPVDDPEMPPSFLLAPLLGPSHDPC